MKNRNFFKKLVTPKMVKDGARNDYNETLEQLNLRNQAIAYGVIVPPHAITSEDMIILNKAINEKLNKV